MFENDKDWAISSETSLETKMNVQRLLKLPKTFYKICRIKQVGVMMGAKEEVNLPNGNVGMGHETEKN